MKKSSPIYVSSKLSHVDKWLKLRSEGWNINSTWIDYVDKPFNRNDLAEKCIDEVKDAHWLLLYCEEGDILKGCLVEVGIALAARTPVKIVGHCKSLENLFDMKWERYETIEEALKSS